MWNRCLCFYWQEVNKGFLSLKSMAVTLVHVFIKLMIFTNCNCERTALYTACKMQLRKSDTVRTRALADLSHCSKWGANLQTYRWLPSESHFQFWDQKLNSISEGHPKWSRFLLSNLVSLTNHIPFYTIGKRFSFWITSLDKRRHKKSEMSILGVKGLK